MKGEAIEYNEFALNIWLNLKLLIDELPKIRASDLPKTLLGSGLAF
jgi:hypothetical protein